MPTIDQTSSSKQSYIAAFGSLLGKIVDNPLTNKVSDCVSGLVNLGLWGKATFVPQITFAADGSIGIMREAIKISYLVAEGGGFKGYCYPPFIKTLNEKLPFLGDLKELAGTSAGAMMAYMIASGTSLDEIEKHLLQVNILNELKGEPISDLTLSKAGIFSANNMIKGMLDLSAKSASTYYQKIKHNRYTLSKISGMSGYNEFIKRADNGFTAGMTFNDLKLLNSLNSKQFKLLNVVGYDQTNKKGIYFNVENYPDVYCHVAVRGSMSIPLMFRPVIFEGKHITDGADESNIPIGVFSSRKNYDPEETMALVFERDGAAKSTLYDPLQKGYMSGIKRIAFLWKKIFSNTIKGVYFRLIVQSFNEKLEEWKTGKKNPIQSNAPGPLNEGKFRAGKPSIIRWLHGGERYLKNRNRDADALYELGSNVLIVPHGEGENTLGTVDVRATPAKIKAAQQTAIKAADEYAEWRKGMASYKTYQNVDIAIDSLREEEKQALIASVKKQLPGFFRRYDDGLLDCNEELFHKHLDNLNHVYEDSNPDMHKVLAVLKFLQAVDP